MLDQMKNLLPLIKRMMNRRMAAGVWIMSLLVMFTVGHLALLQVERNRDLKVLNFQNSTLERLFQRLAISDHAICGDNCIPEVSQKDPDHNTQDTDSNHISLGIGSMIRNVEKNEGDENMEEEEEEELEILLPERAEVVHPEQYQKDVAKRLSSDWTKEMIAAQEEVFRNRTSTVKEICSSMKLTGALAPRLGQTYFNMRYISKHNMIWCPVFKAASTTWVKNLLLMAGETKVTTKSLHARVMQLYKEPEDPRVRDQLLKDAEKMLIIRHPLERLLSAYRDKMLRVRNAHDPHVRLQKEVMKLFPDPKIPPGMEKKDADGFAHPSFTQYLMKVKSDLEKAWSSEGKFLVNMHWRPVWLTCSPCAVNYDFIAKVETLDMDQEYVIRHMGLQDLLYNAHTHSSNFDSYSSTSEAAKDYFKDVPRRLLRDIVELYQPDFTLFSYSPDQYLELTSPEE